MLQDVNSCVADLKTTNLRTILKKGAQLLDNIGAMETSVNEWEFKWSKPTVAACSVSAADMVDFDKTFAGVRLEDDVLRASSSSKAGHQPSDPVTKAAPTPVSVSVSCGGGGKKEKT